MHLWPEAVAAYLWTHPKQLQLVSGRTWSSFNLFLDAPEAAATCFKLHLKQLQLASSCIWSSYNLLQNAPKAAATCIRMHCSNCIVQWILYTHVPENGTWRRPMGGGSVCSLGRPGQKRHFPASRLRFKYCVGVKVCYAANWNLLPKMILSLWTMCWVRARFNLRPSINTNRVTPLLGFLNN